MDLRRREIAGFKDWSVATSEQEKSRHPSHPRKHFFTATLSRTETSDRTRPSFRDIIRWLDTTRAH